MPALLVCPCFINFPTFCERPRHQTVFIPPTLLSQHPLHCTEAHCVDGVRHRTFPFGGPGRADNVLTQSRHLRTSLSRGFFVAESGEARTLQAGGPPTPSFSFAFLGSHRKEGGWGLYNGRLTAFVNTFKMCYFLPRHLHTWNSRVSSGNKDSC